MFVSHADIDPDAFSAALGGADLLTARLPFDPDMQGDPRLEMQLSPSRPFRRQTEKRLMLIDHASAPLRDDPVSDPVIRVDLRTEKARLVAVCEMGCVRLGRLFSLGTVGDAVWVARTFRDLRGIALLSWVLDPNVDRDGKRRATPLSQQEFEEKLFAYDKRLDELDDEEILKSLAPAHVERRDELIIVDVLRADGSWDQRDSLALEERVAAVARFSLLPGAPSKRAPEAPSGNGQSASSPTSAARAEVGLQSSVTSKAPLTPLRVVEVNERVVLVFPPDRFDLDTAAALGKRNYDAVVGPQDPIDRATRDRMERDGAGFVASVDFFSEVLLEGKPLSKTDFDDKSQSVGDARALQVHFPRFGPVLLFALADGKRFVCSETDQPDLSLSQLRRV